MHICAYACIYVYMHMHEYVHIDEMKVMSSFLYTNATYIAGNIIKLQVYIHASCKELHKVKTVYNYRFL